jgi:hypothetical protein
MPKRTFTIQTHDPQADDWYVLSITLMILHDVPDRSNMSSRAGNPGITAPESALKPYGRPDHTFDCWCLIANDANTEVLTSTTIRRMQSRN